MPELSPRCGRRMRRLERGGIPVLEDPACGRPEGHNGWCRSEAALARYQARDTARIARARQERRYGRPQFRRAA